MFKNPKKYQHLTGFDNEEDMRNFQMWNMSKLQDHLFENVTFIIFIIKIKKIIITPLSNTRNSLRIKIGLTLI